ncbi:MAG: ATP-binding cassette domain-containing protein [Bacteroidota bacterium]
MNNQVLDALMHFFAIGDNLNDADNKQRHRVAHFLEQHMDDSKVPEYLALFDRYASTAGLNGIETDAETIRSLCSEINRGLEPRQKFVVFIRICEFVLSEATERDGKSDAFLDLVATVFRLNPDEANAIRAICLPDRLFTPLSGNNVIHIHGHTVEGKKGIQSIDLHDFSGELWVINLQRAGIMAFRYNGEDALTLNGLPFDIDSIQVLSQGGIIRNRRAAAIYHSDLLQRFLETGRAAKLIFEAEKTVYRFKNGTIGLHEFSIDCRSGEMVAIMGGSGAGKSTLLNLLNGTYKPSEGRILLNGKDLATDPEAARGLIGNIPQDDLLIEELTVFDNLFYNSKLCFGDLDDFQLSAKVSDMLKSLGLWEARNLRVGDPLNKTISGGQRKRLNIALELIREPAILFVDEPTSGLSSKDAEHVMDLLKQLAIGGQLVFVVIHQPSSDIFKMFDRLIMLDKGGYLVYNGKPIDALGYFREGAGMIDAGQSICHGCGNINPDQIFNVLEQEMIDEYGNRSSQRRIPAKEWYQQWMQAGSQELKEKKYARLSHPITGKIAGFKKQLKVFLTRDLRAKLSNRQYLLINLLEAPALAAVLATLLRYTAPGKEYQLYLNDNIPAYLFMGVVVSLFFGLSVSGEEILRDRKIRKREAFLNLSRTAYLWSKIALLFTLSAIQMASFVLVGNSILGIDGMTGSFFLVLFTSSCFSNMLGLNISSMMKTSVAVYILIPILIIPQILLSGVIVRFNKLNSGSGYSQEVPVAGNLMISRWAFEAMATEMFKENDYHREFYNEDRAMSRATYVKDYWVREMQKASSRLQRLPDVGKEKEEVQRLLRYELSEGSVARYIGFDGSLFQQQPWNATVIAAIDSSLEKIRMTAVAQYNQTADAKDNKMVRLTSNENSRTRLELLMVQNENQALNDMLTNHAERTKIFVADDKLIGQFEPVYRYLDPTESFFQQPYLIAEKRFFGQTVNTIWANVAIIGMMTLLLYLLLQSDVLTRRD